MGKAKRTNKEIYWRYTLKIRNTIRTEINIVTRFWSFDTKYFYIPQYKSYFKFIVAFNPLSTNLTKWSNTLKQFVGCCQRIFWVWPFRGLVFEWLRLLLRLISFILILQERDILTEKMAGLSKNSIARSTILLLLRRCSCNSFQVTSELILQKFLRWVLGVSPHHHS